ncbi:hypothetical protein HYT92_01535 [Candidatus Pacearchaeota archaeon]|nr:hypothetical protein [Candidatus Pacearchaeota archaeon]
MATITQKEAIKEKLLRQWKESWDKYEAFKLELRFLERELLAENSDSYAAKSLCFEIDEMIKELYLIVAKRHNNALSHLNKLLEMMG